MAEKTFEEEKNNGWTYVGRNSKGEPKFRKYTNETWIYRNRQNYFSSSDGYM